MYCRLYITFRDKTLSTVTEQMEKLEEKLKSTNETLDAKLSQIQVSTHIILLLNVITFVLQLLLLLSFVNCQRDHNISNILTIIIENVDLSLDDVICQTLPV